MGPKHPGRAIFGHRGAGVKFLELLKHATDVLAPQDCVLCAARAGRTMVCVACRAELPQLMPHCPRCALASARDEICGRCQRDPPAAIATVAVWPYRYPVDRLIQRLKYRAQLPLAAWFAAALAQAVRAAGQSSALVIAVPLAPDRLRERGFNQSAEIARRVGRALDVPVDLFALERIRSTSPQVALALGERERNVRGAFRANAAIIGQHVAVVDDVMTSGATLAEIGRTLLDSGARSVRNWVVTRKQ